MHSKGTTVEMMLNYLYEVELSDWGPVNSYKIQSECWQFNFNLIQVRKQWFVAIIKVIIVKYWKGASIYGLKSASLQMDCDKIS